MSYFRRLRNVALRRSPESFVENLSQSLSPSILKNYTPKLNLPIIWKTCCSGVRSNGRLPRFEHFLQRCLHGKQAINSAKIRFLFWQQRIPVFKKVYHEDFVSVDSSAGITTDNDVCLLFLSRPIQWNDATAPACLPEPGDEPVEGERCFTAGWGLTFPGQGSMHPNLKETYADIIPSGKGWKNGNLSQFLK